MRLDDETASTHIEDRRGRRLPVRAGGIGVGTILLALAASYFFGIDPGTVIGVAQQFDTAGSRNAPRAGPPPAADEQSQFLAKVLGSTERTWTDVFEQGGSRYREPTLVLFEGGTRTACGTGDSAMGPFYCPGDQQIYLDVSFFRDLAARFGAPGDFAQAYVVAHEVGHHVQNLLGVSDKVQAARQNARSEAEANALSVRLELQADCFAGVWAARAHESRRILEAGDVEEALTAATAIGDDRLQRQARGRVVPDSFTHGSSAQRVRWFRRGLEVGDVKACNTFGVSAASL